MIAEKENILNDNGWDIGKLFMRKYWKLKTEYDILYFDDDDDNDA